MSGNTLFGWDLLYNSVAKDIKCDDDILLCLTHLVLVSRGFQCIGLGDSKTLDNNEVKTESLPAGWNDNYRLRYLYQGRLYNLQATKLDDGLMVNLIRVDERTVSMVQLNNSAVLQRSGNLEEMIPTNSALVKLIRDQLIDKVVTSNKTKDNTSQTVATTSTSRRTSNPLLVERYPAYSIPPVFSADPFARDIGRRDLDPLAGIGGPRLGGFPRIDPLGPGGGGMLFEPPRRSDPNRTGMPPGAIPPGARFDPFRPPEVDRFPQGGRRPAPPDNDELPPPGYDDMYM